MHVSAGLYVCGVFLCFHATVINSCSSSSWCRSARVIGVHIIIPYILLIPGTYVYIYIYCPSSDKWVPLHCPVREYPLTLYVYTYMHINHTLIYTRRICVRSVCEFPVWHLSASVYPILFRAVSLSCCRNYSNQSTLHVRGSIRFWTYSPLLLILIALLLGSWSVNIVALFSTSIIQRFDFLLSSTYIYVTERNICAMLTP